MQPTFDFGGKAMATAERSERARVKRLCFRCRDCLTVMFDTANIESEPCGVCHGRIELLGEVGPGDRLRVSYVDAVCDDRCTSARGRNCSCSCGGENHGSHKWCIRTADRGPVPADLRPRERDGLAERVDKWRARIDAARQRLHARYPELAAKSRGQWVDNWPRYMKGANISSALQDAKSALTWATREKRLASVESMLE